MSGDAKAATPKAKDKDTPDPRPAIPARKEQPTGVTVTAPDGARVARAEGATIRVLNAAENKVLATFQSGARVTALAFTADGQVVFSAGEDKELRAWSVPLRQEVYRTSLGDVPGLLTLSPQGKGVICTGGKYLIEVEAASGKIVVQGPPGTRTFLP
jgi:hypothetical protein